VEAGLASRPHVPLIPPGIRSTHPEAPLRCTELQSRLNRSPSLQVTHGNLPASDTTYDCLLPDRMGSPTSRPRSYPLLPNSFGVLWPRLSPPGTENCLVLRSPVIISRDQLTVCTGASQNLPLGGYNPLRASLSNAGWTTLGVGLLTQCCSSRPLFASGFFRSSPCGKRPAFSL